MMPAVVVPVVVVAPVAIVTEAARTIIGPDNTAAGIRIVRRVIIIVIIRVGRAVEEAPMEAMMTERKPAVVKAPMENMRPSKSATVEGRTGVINWC